MNREEFIGKLQMVYVGDRNAFNEIVEDNQKLKNEVVYSKVEIDRLNNIILNQQKRIDKTIQAIDEILIYNDLSDTTSAFGNAPRELKFYLSECDTLEEFDKLKELKENK